MRLRSLVWLVLVAALVIPTARVTAAAAGRASDLREQIAAVREREDRLRAEIAGTTAQMRELEARVGDVSRRLATLTQDVTLHRRRLAAVKALLATQTRQLRLLAAEATRAQRRLEKRLVAIYESESPSTLELVLAARSFDDLLDQVEYARTVAVDDRRIADEVRDGRDRLREVRRKTRRSASAVAAATRTVEYRLRQSAELRARLVAQAGSLEDGRAESRRKLATAQEQEAAWVAEADALAAPSAAIATELQSAQRGSPTAAPSAAGFVWPVSGPITSGFGTRWGRLHAGIDVSAPEGTPLRAAAAGRVVLARYDGGYGNLVVIDHGGGVATAYAHQSRMAVAVGQQVAQGELIGYVGSTGFSTGPHLHFEVRINGQPVDPMGYL